MVRLACTDGVPFTFGPAADGLIKTAGRRLQAQIRPRITPVQETDGALQVRGILGTIRLGDGSVLEVAPKVDPSEDWVSATLDLLLGDTRFDVGAERLAGPAPQRRGLLEALAAMYASRLSNALRRDGPLMTIERVDRDSPRLIGRLRVSVWSRNAYVRPAHLPISHDRLSADNDYTRALSVAARQLGLATSDWRTRASLFEGMRALRPGHAEQVEYNRTVIERPVPPQWAAYAPAWSIAKTILSKRSPLASRGAVHGVEVAVEAWPLMETLLARALDQAARVAVANNRSVVSKPGTSPVLLTAESAGVTGRKVEPDGRLDEAPTVLATFEAKYSRRSSDWPPREHYFQAISTAAAARSPLAVLVYPESFAPVTWLVSGFGGFPHRLAAVGLGLFSYRRGAGDVKRGEALWDIVANGAPI